MFGYSINDYFDMRELRDELKMQKEIESERRSHSYEDGMNDGLQEGLNTGYKNGIYDGKIKGVEIALDILDNSIGDLKEIVDKYSIPKEFVERLLQYRK